MQRGVCPASSFPQSQLFSHQVPRLSKTPARPARCKGPWGGSVQLQLTFSPSPDIREIEWIRDSGDERDLILVSWKPDTYTPECMALKKNANTDSA